MPHFVTSKENGQYLFDTHCPQWVSSKICSHTLAVAEICGKLANFLHWYISTNQDTNVTALGLLNMPRCRGQKGGVPKRKRSKTSDPEVVVSRPSLQDSGSNVSISVSSSPHSSVFPPTTIHGPSMTHPPFQPDYYSSPPYSMPSTPNFAVQPSNPNCGTDLNM